VRFYALFMVMPSLVLGSARVQALEPAEPSPSSDTPSSSHSAPRFRPIELRASAELGYLASLSHHIRFGQDGTDFDYVGEGGQDTLFAVSRLSVDVSFHQRHTLVFMYQPLRLDTRVVLERDVTVYDQTYAAGTPMALRYDFPFYRASYLYNFARKPGRELELGLSLQLRNATIEFATLSGEALTSNRNVGPVPILKARWTEPFSHGLWMGAEADGFYAPISYLNGSDNEVIGAILDASVRGGISLPMRSRAFVNVRYLGGGSVGTSTGDDVQGDGFVENWLHFLTVTLGVSIDL